VIGKIIEYLIGKRVQVILSFVLIGLLSIFSFKESNVDAIPDIGENQQIVFTKWPGRSPKDIEQQVTYPLSINLEGIPGVKSVRGISSFGFSTIYVIFDDQVDFYWSRSRILEKISSINKEIPDGVKPELGPDATGLGQVFWYVLENDKNAKNPKSLGDLRSLQDYYVKYLLQGSEGVSEVATVGGFVKEYQIDVDPKKLFAYNVHFNKLISSIENSNIDVGAEVIEEGDRELVVRGKGFFKSIQDIENVVIGIRDKRPVRVKEVANVKVGAGFRRGALDKNGQEVVGGVVTMRFGENPKKVIEKLKEKISTVKKGLPAGVLLTPFYDRTVLINKTIKTVYRALAEEIMITIVIVLIFLAHFRSSLLISLTLPFGVGISFIFMKYLNIDSNVMSLSGIVIAIGSMVDMGIIMTENIYRNLSEKNDVNEEDRLRIIIQSAKEVGPAILIAVLTTIVTFLPVFGLEGSEGKLFGPLAWTKTLAMFGAVVVSIFLVPSLSVYLLRGNLKSIEKSKISLFIIYNYKKLLMWLLERRKLFAILPVLLILGGGIAYLNVGKEFMPSLNEGDLLYMPVTTPNVSMTKARELLSYTDNVLNDHPLVDSAIGKLGRADSALDPAPIGMFETIVKLIPKEEWPEGFSIYDIIEELDQKLQIPGLVNSWDFPIQTRVGMVSTGIKTQVGIKIFGDDLDILESLASKVAQEVRMVEGSYGVYPEKINGKTYLEFNIDRVAASRYGINTGTINKVLQTAVGGMPIGQFYEGRERYSIRVRYKKELRDRIDELKRVLVPSPLGQHIPIEQLADIQIVTGPAAIQSENGMLRSTVLLNVRGRDLVGFVEEAKKIVREKVDFPKGYAIIWAGEFENQQKANQRLMLLIPLALLINLLIIYFGIKSFRDALIIFSAVPIAMSGGMILLWFCNFNISVGVWVGFIALFGLAVDDGVVMMTYLKKSTGEIKPKDWTSLKNVIAQAGSRRIRPLVMTTVTTIVALLPVMWSNSTGSEVMKPMAVPILGGMMVEFVTLFIVPLIYSYAEEKKYRSRNDKNNID